MLEKLQSDAWDLEAATHLLSRAGFGGRPREREALYVLGREEGPEAAVESLFGEDGWWEAFPFPDWWDKGTNNEAPGGWGPSQDGFIFWCFEQFVNGPPLAAKMLKFYIDHFPIDYRIQLNHQKLIYFFEHIHLCRRLALGNFGQLVREMSWTPAMIQTLDLHYSRRWAVNENFARELLELFTMGVDGGYTEKDVNECARAFSGRSVAWQYPDDYPYPSFLNESTFQEGPLKGFYSHIDNDEKTILGRTLAAFEPGGAVKEHGDEVIRIILERPECGQHMAWKLWRYFVEPEPSKELLEELGRRFRDYDYEVRPLLRDIFLSQEFYDQPNRSNQIKDPVDLLVNALVLLDHEPLPKATTVVVLDKLGYHPLFPPSIAGWPEPIREGNQWLGASRMMTRINLPLLWTEGDNRFLPQNYRSVYRRVREDLPYTRPDFMALVPLSVLAEENDALMIECLWEHFLPQHKMKAAQKRVLLNYRKRRRGQQADEDHIRELVRQLMALPEFQLQ